MATVLPLPSYLEQLTLTRVFMQSYLDAWAEARTKMLKERREKRMVKELREGRP